MLFSLGISLKDKPLHQTVSLIDSFLNQFLNRKFIDQFMVQKRFLNFFTCNCIFANLVANQSHRWNVNQIIILCKAFSKCGAATMWGSDDENMWRGSGRERDSFDLKGSSELFHDVIFLAIFTEINLGITVVERFELFDVGFVLHDHQ